MVRERLFIYLVEGFIGFCFILYALGPLMTITWTQDASILIATFLALFFVGIASFAGIPVLRKSSAKGIKLFVIISVIQIGAIICCFIAKTPGMGGPDIIDNFGRSGGGLTFVSILSVFVLAILIYFYMKKRQRFN
jgi:hypothetical protein